MVARSPRASSFNPFYVLLLVASTAFVLSVLAYLMAPAVKQQAAQPTAGAPAPSAGSLAFADWIEANAPRVIAGELAVMTVTGLLAIVTEHFLSKRRGGTPPALAPSSPQTPPSNETSAHGSD